MEMHVVARRWGVRLAAVSGVVLLLAVAANEIAVRDAGVSITDIASYPAGLAALLAFLAVFLGMRRHIDVDPSGRHGPALAVLLGGLLALVTAFFIFMSPSLFNFGVQCFDPGSGACVDGTPIPAAGFAPFYEAAFAVAAGGVLALISAALTTRADKQRSNP